MYDSNKIFLSPKTTNLIYKKKVRETIKINTYQNKYYIIERVQIYFSFSYFAKNWMR